MRYDKSYEEEIILVILPSKHNVLRIPTNNEIICYYLIFMNPPFFLYVYTW